MDVSQEKIQGQTGLSKEKRKELSQTIKSLKLTRSPLGKTLLHMKLNQEALQTSVKTKAAKTQTAQFRLDAVKQHGSGSLAYSALQADMQYFMKEDLGFIAYKQLPDSKDSVCVLADPICAPEKNQELILEFLKVKNDPVWLHIRHDTAKILSDLGFCVNELGLETFIDIQEFNLVGNKKQQLRAARNNAKKDKIKVRELMSVDDPLLVAFKRISDSWMTGKVICDQEMKFIVRPIVYVDEVDVRKFIAVKDDEIVGFIIFDPMYKDGEVIGYIANHLRSNLDRSYSVVDYIILEAIEQFKLEGKKLISLGLSPLAKVDDGDEFKYSKLLKAHFQYSFERANFLYNFKNLYRHKTKYRPELPGAHEEKVYCAMKTRFMLVRMYSVYRVLGFDPIHQTAQHVRQVVGDWFRSHLLVQPDGKQADKSGVAK